MHEPLRAEDFLPLIAKLSREEQVRLAELALGAAGTDTDGLASDEDSLGWDAEGWDELLPPR